ncbi:signal transduction histidine kinase [Streptomyces sp. LBL]|uniref:sensor histidine kinase n=1 Tax=Streptomyces sp. LBL TaxID=2940562 RepID=UPI0024756B28|nr:nitrate- and nitrite sensing domain-containing protein [Streptomyces sp. LBL]MDH6625598.1 signal transduction histidine kinase [Streptomyces sp. LBL]
MSRRTGSRRRLGSIRLSLILLALVPSVTLAALWGLTTTQMFSEGLRLRSQTELSMSTGAMGTDATLALQRERGLSAAWLAAQPGSRAALDRARGETDKAVAKLVGRADAIQKAPTRVADRLYSVVGSVGSLEYYRSQVNNPTDITAEQALDQYTSIIDDQIHAFQELSQVDDGDLTSQAGPLVALEHAAELVSQEDARLTLAWPSGYLDEKARTEFGHMVNTRRWIVQDEIVPALRGSTKAQTERILQSPQWQTLQTVEDRVLAARPSDAHRVALPEAQKQWATAMKTVAAEYGALIRQQTSALLDRSADKADGLLLTAASLSAGGLVAVLLCVGMSWRITRSLSRRLHGLREATLGLAEERLPDVVRRLERGEKVDIDLAAPPLDYGSDELGQVAQAFNTAQRTAVVTTVELADTRRGFQKVILGIARQSQNLVNLQLSQLDALEREHQDPDVLKGLYELDSTASQLRRYEENLVIISGEQPRRSWTEPVALVDILRSAVGEVAEYQRVEVLTDLEVFLVPPAVADVIHLLAELIDNATAYSPAPSPVGVRAAMVAKGLAVEVEDRGLGLSEEEYASLNAQLADPPQFDVVALADDLRLGMFVISRLARRHGIGVTLRSSPYGGTTAIVLIPHEVVVPEAAVVRPAKGAASTAAPESRKDAVKDPDPVQNPDPSPTPHAHRLVPTARTSATTRTPAPATTPTPAPATARTSATATATAPGPAPRFDGLTPLPRRVPQTSLVAELREEASADETDADADADFTAEHAASSLAGFQAGTLRARDEDGPAPDGDGPAPDEGGPAPCNDVPTRHDDKDDATPYDDKDEPTPYDDKEDLPPYDKQGSAPPDLFASNPAVIPTSHADRS